MTSCELGFASTELKNWFARFPLWVPIIIMSQNSVPGPYKESQVAEDQIRKITAEKVTRNQIYVWPRRWNWMIDENKKMYEAMAGKRPLSPYDETRFSSLDKPAGKKGKAEKRMEEIMLPPIPAIPAKPQIPVTTSGWYGFVPKVNGRSVVSDRQRWCKVTVGQHDLLHLLDWPTIYD
ncbi:hypothetical protein ACOMHN_038767 [Nucella lapillus]